MRRRTFVRSVLISATGVFALVIAGCAGPGAGSPCVRYYALPLSMGGECADIQRRIQ